MSLSEFTKNAQVVKCKPDVPVHEVAELMRVHNIGSVLIMDGNKPSGIITDRDIALKVVARQHSSDDPVYEFMNSPVETIGRDRGLHDLISLMREKRIRRLVIVDDKQKPLGIVSQGDVLNLLAAEVSEIVSGTCPEEDKLIGERKVS